MRTRTRRVNATTAPSDGPDVASHQIRHWGIASALFVALITIHADLATVADGAGQRRPVIKKNRNDIASSSASPSGGSASLGDLDNQSPLKPMLVPDPSETTRDPLIAGRVKHVRLTKDGFKNEEDAMVKTRSFLINQTQHQSKRERDLRYLNMHANLLVGDTFQSKLVGELKKVKNETRHILNLRGNRRNKGRKRRSVEIETLPGNEEERKMKDESIRVREIGSQRVEATVVAGEEKPPKGDQRKIPKKGETEKKARKYKKETAWEKNLSEVKNNGKPRNQNRKETLAREIRGGRNDARRSESGAEWGGVGRSESGAEWPLRRRRGVPPWKDYLYNLPASERGKYHIRIRDMKQKETDGNHYENNDTHEKEGQVIPIYDVDEPIALSPIQEENFRQNLDDLLKKLDAETESYQDKEERKISRLERRKNLYLEHATEMGRKSEDSPSNPVFLEEVEDLIRAAQLQNAIAKEKDKVVRIIGNSNAPRRPIFSRFKDEENRMKSPASTRRNEIQTHISKNRYDNELPILYTNTHRTADNDNDLSIHNIPRRKVMPMMKMEKLSGERSNICPEVDNYISGCSNLMGSRDYKIIFYNYCSQHQMCYRCGIASSKDKEDCDNHFVDAAVEVCGIESIACLSTADFFLRQLQRSPFYFYPFPLSNGGKCADDCVRNFVTF